MTFQPDDVAEVSSIVTTLPTVHGPGVVVAVPLVLEAEVDNVVIEVVAIVGVVEVAVVVVDVVGWIHTKRTASVATLSPVKVPLDCATP